MPPAPVRAERIGSVLALVLDAPPDNALTPALRKALAAALDGLTAEVRAVLLLGEGPRFANDGEGDPAEEPTMSDLCDRIEALPVPVIAAIQSRAIGDGAALALAAHYRIGTDGAALVFPAVTQDLCPSAGATQRLPRLIGPAAVAALLTGQPVAVGLFDTVVPRAALTEAALAFAAAAPAPRPTGGRREGFADPAAYRAAIAAARTANSRRIAQARILDCLEAAMLFPLPQGLTLETTVAEELAARPEAQALAAIGAAERRALAAARTVPAPDRIAVWGAEGADIAQDAVAAGLSVTLIEASEATLQLALEVVAEGLAAEVRAGRLTAEAKDAAWTRLTPALPAAAVAADLHLLAGPWAETPPEIAPPALAATLDSPGASAPGVLLAETGRLAEVVGSPETQGPLLAFLARIGRLPVVSRGAGVLAAMRAALSHAVAVETARTGAADAVAGVVAGLCRGPGPAAALPEVEARLRAALANQGLKLLGSGTALRPSDIDLALVHGAGWRRNVLGPMAWAADRGALVLRADLARLAPEAPELWSPAPFLGRLIHDEVRIEALDA
jgi:3-hydroxyacyl-CoA dehydrogenase